MIWFCFCLLALNFSDPCWTPLSEHISTQTSTGHGRLFCFLINRVWHAQQSAPLQDYIVFIYNIIMSNYITIFQLHHEFFNYNNTSHQLHHFYSITIIVLFEYNNDDHTITTIPWNDNNSSITITLHFNYNISIQLQ